jgi:hypothetical protein
MLFTKLIEVNKKKGFISDLRNLASICIIDNNHMEVSELTPLAHVLLRHVHFQYSSFATGCRRATQKSHQLLQLVDVENST